MPLINPSIELQVCSHQKDEHYSNMLKSNITSWASLMFGEMFTLKNTNYISMISSLLYHSITSLSGLQTLGEEYVNIIQVDSSGSRVPSFTRRLLSVLLRTSFLPIVQQYNKQHKLKRNLSPESEQQDQDLKTLIIENFAFIAEAVKKLNFAAFLISQKHYDVSKRVSDVGYVKIVPSVSRSSRDNDKYDVIGRLLAFRVLFAVVRKVQAVQKKLEVERGKLGSKVKQAESDREQVTCGICQESAEHASITKCGHIYCWSCIQTWIGNKPQCPICRQKIESNQVACLRNYP